jgi:putative endonuclease
VSKAKSGHRTIASKSPIGKTRGLLSSLYEDDPMKTGHRLSIGRLGESLAAAYLQEKGYTIQERNRHTPYGEIDIITVSGQVMVFVEVKTRTSRSLGPPEISITPRKTDHMRSAAEYYIQQHPELDYDWRIDVIAIQLQGGNAPPLIDHFENVLT